MCRRHSPTRPAFPRRRASDNSACVIARAHRQSVDSQADVLMVHTPSPARRWIAKVVEGANCEAGLVDVGRECWYARASFVRGCARLHGRTRKWLGVAPEPFVF